MAHDHSTHDHSMHTTGSCNNSPPPKQCLTSMAMTFSWSFETTVLFNSWKTTGPTSMFFLCIVIFALALGHEYLQVQRSIVDARYSAILDRGRSTADDDDTLALTSTTQPTIGNEEGITTANGNQTMTKGSLEKYHLLRTGYHVISAFTSLTIMTVFMTLNMWIVFAVLAGTVKNSRNV
ncbi:Ctr copper transporter family-domain-containing protein, partial [Obelidium mucronatum]